MNSVIAVIIVYLGLLAGLTERIALGVASIVLPLRHPAHVAKAAASVDVLSGGRLLLGVASGDRPEEYPALNLPFADRGERAPAAVADGSAPDAAAGPAPAGESTDKPCRLRKSAVSCSRRSGTSVSPRLRSAPQRSW